MTRLILLFSIVILSSPVAKATHIIGGDFSVEWISSNEFRPELKIFRDCNSTIEFDSLIAITLYDSNTDTVFGIFEMHNPVIDFIILGDECYTPTGLLCVEQGVYSDTISIPYNPGGYYMAWQTCCRNDGIVNIQNPVSQGMVFVCTIPSPALHNSSPVFGDYPNTGYFCIGLENELNFNVTDADSDSLVYYFDNSLTGEPTFSPTDTTGPKPYEPCVWQDGYTLENILGTSVPMTIDSQTGTISVIPEELGVYVFAIIVDEYRDGILIGSVRREIQFQALLCIADPLAFTSPTDTMYEVVAEYFIALDIIVDAFSSTDPITIEANSELFLPNVGYPAEFEAGTGEGSITSYFSWQTICDNILDEYIPVNFKAYSDCNQEDTAYYSIYIKVIPDIEWDSPNIFTPNNDGKNEYFSIDVDLDPCFDTFSVEVYDRWGLKVYESTDPEFKWNGVNMFNDKKVSDGNYFYIIYATFKNVPYRKTSYVTVLR